MTGPSALFVGDISVDLTMTIGHIPGPDEKVHVDNAVEAPGGVVANAAVACVRAGVPARLLVQTGGDAAGRIAIDGVRAAGVDVVSMDGEAGTCRVVILVEPHGEKRLLLYPGTSMYPSSRQVQGQSLADVGWVHTAIYDREAAAILAARCRQAGVPWSVDLEPATIPDDVAALGDVIAGSDVVFCNSHAMARMGGDAEARLFGLGTQTIVLTRGRLGVVLVDRNGERASIPAPEVSVVDTTGAGDCLAGWFVAGRLRRLTAAAALRQAVLAASLSCGRTGAQSSFPTRDEVLAHSAATTSPPVETIQ